MDKKDIGVLQQTLVPNIQNGEVPAKKLLQYIASLSSTIGAIAVGMVLSWTNSAGTDGASIQALYGIEISPSEFSWISSLSTLGSGIMCIFIGFLTDFMGRKYAMLLMVVPFTIGWLLIIFANSVIMLCIGRFISGLSAGAFCIAAPMYSAEIALVSVCIYCTSFSLGFGPVPWMMLGEIFAPEVKAMASSSVGFLSWILAFIVIKFYNDIKTEINTGPTFWMFSAMCILAALFVYFIVPETKGKSLVTIQRELNK